MRRALIFAGQGQQFLHMGQDLAAAYPQVQALYDKAQAISGIDILNLNEEDINQTRFTQLALYVLECSVLSLLEDLKYDVVCGLSLGEYGALTAAKVLDFEAGVKLLQNRGAIMDQAFDPGTTGMAALLKTDIDTVEAALQDTNVEICNYNTASQFVIGGLKSDLEAITPILKEKGIRMIIPLKVSSVSHMSLLEDASVQLRELLDKVDFKAPQCQFIANVSADYQVDGFAQSLQKQISQRTRMHETITRMVNDGVREFVEIGPAGSLSKFIKAYDKSLVTDCIYDLETLKLYQERNGV